MADVTEQRVQEIENSVSTLESQLRSQIARTQSGTRAILVIGIILIAIVFAYMAWITGYVKEYAQPDALAEVIDGEVQRHVPDLLNRIEARVKDRELARGYVDYAYNEAIGAVPRLRQRAEKQLDKIVDHFGDLLDARIDGIVANVLEESRVEIQELVKAASDEDAAEKLRGAFKTSLEEALGAELRNAMARAEAKLSAVEKRIEVLSKPDDELNEEKLAEKEMVAWVLMFVDEALAGNVTLLPEEGLDTE